MKNIQLALIILIPLLGLIFLPSEVISHFDANGTADVTLPRLACILLFTAISLILTFGSGLVAKSSNYREQEIHGMKIGFMEMV